MSAIPSHCWIALQWRLRPITLTGICDAAMYGITINFFVPRPNATIDDQVVADRYGAELVKE